MSRRRRAPKTPPHQRTWARYSRVSDERGRAGESFHSPEQQDEDIRRNITELGGREGPRFYDGSVSGGSMDRPEFLRAYAWVLGAPEERGIMTYDFSRFGRTEEVTEWYAKLGAVGSELLTVKDDIENTLMRNVLVGLNAYYREQVGDRYASIIERRFEVGHHHGTPPVGYYREGGSGPLLVHPEHGPVVREIFERYARNDTVRSLAEYLARGVGGQATTARIRHMLAIEAYRGVVSLGGETRPGLHEPLVSQEVWELCQARRRQQAGMASRTLQRVHVLSGLLVCGTCLRKLHIRTAKNERIAVCASYLLRDQQTGERECETGVGAPSLAKLEEAVLEKIAEWALPDDSRTSARSDLLGAVAQEAALLGAAEERLQKAQDAVTRADAAFLSGDLDRARYNRALGSLRSSETEAQAAVDACRIALSHAETRAAGIPDGNQRRALQTVVEAWPEADENERRRMLDSWLVGVVVFRRANQREPLADYVEITPRAFVGTGLRGIAAFADEIETRRAAISADIR